jgi:hypothetical protein|tara:strand:- start:532 stop:696 length:165 start_codon:yes stop_codon:yes gene_type:complete
MQTPTEKIYHFCNIQIQILKEREERLRKEILDCKIQQEFLTSLIGDINDKKHHR